MARLVLKKGRMQLTRADQYTMLATFEKLPVAREARQEEQVTRWKTGKKESWIRYKEASKKASRKIDKIVEETDLSIDEVVKKVEAIETKVKFEVFGKCSANKTSKLYTSITEENNTLEDEDKAKELLECQTKRLDEEINKVKETGRNKAGRIFQISKIIKGLESNGSKATAVKDPSTGTLIVDKEEIKKTTVQYCKEVLKKNEPKKGFEHVAQIKLALHNKRMKEKLGQGFIAKKEAFNLILDKFKKNNKRNYDFIVKSSLEYQEAIFKLCKRIIEEETIPEKFRNTTLHQVWKKKPGTKKEDLEANRFIHCKEWLPRAVESLVVAEMELNIAEATSIYQIGGVAGHRPQEHLFCLKSLQAKYERDKKLIILYPHDAAKFFDKEVLVDCMAELHTAKVDACAYRLFFLLNQNTRIRVRTGCGLTDWEEAGDGLGQGSGGAAKVSALNLDRKLDRMFKNSKQMVNYGSVR